MHFTEPKAPGEAASPGHACTRIWQALGNVSRLEFTARSLTGTTGWNGEGRGRVEVSAENDHTLVFRETGKWNPELDSGKSGPGHRELDFSNTYRWTLHDPHRGISLSHLRYGRQNPVHLAELVHDRQNRHLLKSASPHLCNLDRYTLDLCADSEGLTLRWKIEGPAKNEHLVYRYR